MESRKMGPDEPVRKQLMWTRGLREGGIQLRVTLTCTHSHV